MRSSRIVISSHLRYVGPSSGNGRAVVGEIAHAHVGAHLDVGVIHIGVHIGVHVHVHIHVHVHVGVEAALVATVVHHGVSEAHVEVRVHEVGVHEVGVHEVGVHEVGIHAHVGVRVPLWVLLAVKLLHFLSVLDVHVDGDHGLAGKKLGDLGVLSEFDKGLLESHSGFKK